MEPAYIQAIRKIAKKKNLEIHKIKNQDLYVLYTPTSQKIMNREEVEKMLGVKKCKKTK